jgi:hypothetical protein
LLTVQQVCTCYRPLRSVERACVGLESGRCGRNAIIDEKTAPAAARKRGQVHVLEDETTAALRREMGQHSSAARHRQQRCCEVEQQ